MKAEYVEINHDELNLEQVKYILESGSKLKLSQQAVQAITKCREYLDRRMESQETPIYGINTGFGSLCNTQISNDQLGQLQENLVMSHACGAGEEVPRNIVRLMLLLKIQGLSYGYSGVQLSTVEGLIQMYNNDVIPQVFQQGSLGASGDLAPLAHMCLPLIGKGKVYFKNELVASQRAMETLGWTPIQLKSKEGLALLNGTQFMSAYGSWLVLKGKELIEKANTLAALSLDGFMGRLEPFSELPHKVRKQPGQLRVARHVRKTIEGSEIQKEEKVQVQDPYSFRCVPQVHGACWDVINFVEQIITNEINSVTDNPTVFSADDQIISAGNFHGQPLAMALDQLAIALAEIGSISERRVYKLISGDRGLPAFLVANPGLNSGFMIPQYTAAGIVSQNKQLCTPASVDTIDSSNGQEDHVSMGANAATKCYRVAENLMQILGIELMNAAQAVELRRPLKSSEYLEGIVSDFRKKVPFVSNDVVLHDLMVEAKNFIAVDWKL